MDGFQFEFVRKAPVEGIIALYKDFGWWVESEENRRALPQLIRGSFAFLIVKDERGDLVGMGRVLSDGISDAYIHDVVVRKSLRGRGIGRQIIQHLIDHCRAKGIGWIGLIGQPGTETFYSSIGFSPMQDHTPMLINSVGTVCE